MNTPVKKFLWLDDSPSSISPSLRGAIRESGYNAGEETDLKIIGVDGKEVGTALTELLGGPQPDLIILDHFLNKAAGTVFRKGSTVAAEIRDHWPNVPIIGVTGAINTWNDKLSHLAITEYLAIFERDKLATEIGTLHVLAYGFQRIGTETSPATERLSKLVAAPNSDLSTLLMALPVDLKNRSDPGTAHSLARWLLHEFLSRPGFLYDRLHAATLVGLTESGFTKVEKYFEEAAYRGVFHSSEPPRWWVSQLKQCLLKAVPEPRLASPAKRGRLLPGIDSADHSRCHFTDADWPDVTASPDETSGLVFPAVSEVTAIAKNDTPSVGFQPRRVFVRQSEKK